MKHAFSRHLAIALLTAAFAAPAGFAATDAPATASKEIKLGSLSYRGVVPSSWQSVPPETNKRLLQFRTSDTTAAAEVIVFYFGPGEGGSAEANIQRWRGQFIGDNHTPITPVVERFKSHGMSATTAELRGTYARGIGVGPVGTPKPDQTLFAAVVESPEGNLILQLFGNSATVARERNAFLAFVRSIAPAAP
jgi:hypothetical protein